MSGALVFNIQENGRRLFVICRASVVMAFCDFSGFFLLLFCVFLFFRTSCYKHFFVMF